MPGAIEIPRIIFKMRLRKSPLRRTARAGGLSVGGCKLSRKAVLSLFFTMLVFWGCAVVWWFSPRQSAGLFYDSESGLVEDSNGDSGSHGINSLNEKTILTITINL